MIILDTQAISQLQRIGTNSQSRLTARLEKLPEEEIWISIISPYEQFTENLARINATSTRIEKQIQEFKALGRLLDYYITWDGRILLFDQAAADVFRRFPPELIRRIGPRDARIAAIALANMDLVRAPRGPDCGGTAMGSKSKKAGKADKTEVILLRLGVGKQGFHLPAGATLGDLLRAAEVNFVNQEIFIDGKSIEDAVVLQPGTIISLAPRPRNESAPRSWQETIGMFHRDGEFRKPVDAAEKSREAEKDGD